MANASHRLKPILKLLSKAQAKTKQLGHFLWRLAIKYKRLLLTTVGVAGLVFILIVAFLLKDVPNPNKLTRTPAPVSTQILDREGQLLYEIYLDKNRTPVEISDLPETIKQATIAIEDKNFYQHHGLDLPGILRAAFRTLTGQRLEGGSTITQQLVKIALLDDPSRTVTRKIREVVLALVTEFAYSKDEILELYLNHIPYGGTAYGIESASRTYFDKSAKDLTLAEATFLAGLPQAPSRYSPFGANPELGKQRQRLVLNRMVEDGYLTSEQADQVFAENLTFANSNTTIKAPHFVFWIRDLLVERYGEERVNLGGLRVTTSLDLKIQEAAQASLSAEIVRLSRLRVGNGASLVTRPKTGEVLAMVGSRDYFDREHDGQVNVTTSLRQPGSSIKPLNFATGLLNGWTASQVFLDLPTCFIVSGQTPYCPKNYDNSFRGAVQMRFALGNSLNIPSVKMLALNGIEPFIATASAMGITGWDDPSRYGLSLTLGGGEVRMVDLAVAFGVFANGGVKVPLQPLLRVETYQGEVLEEFNTTEIADYVASQTLDWDSFWEESARGASGAVAPDVASTPTPAKNNNLLGQLFQRATEVVQPKIILPHPADSIRTVLPEEVAYIMSHILLDNNARSGAFGPSSELVIPNKTVSVKTGTTNDLRDNWTIGYNPDYLVAVWVGNNDNSAMSYIASGVTGAAPIWNDIMRFILRGQPDHFPSQPSGVVTAQVCALNGLQPTAENPCETRTELYVKNHLPGPNYPSRRQIWIRRDTKTPLLPGDNVIDLDLEEHAIISDPFVGEFCLDCNWGTTPDPSPTDPNRVKINFPTLNVDYDRLRANPPKPGNSQPSLPTNP